MAARTVSHVRETTSIKCQHKKTTALLWQWRTLTHDTAAVVRRTTQTYAALLRNSVTADATHLNHVNREAQPRDPQGRGTD